MTAREKVLTAVAAMLLMLLALGFRAWLHEHDLRASADAVQRQQKQVIVQAQSQIKQAKADRALADSDLKTTLAALEAEKSKPVTPAQFVVGINKAIPNLREPVSTQLKPETIPVSGETKAPVAETQIVIPEADLPALRAYKIGCDESAAKLTACQLTAASLSSQLDGTGQQLDAMATERDSWKKAAKGGSFWSRLRKRVKCLAISGGGAAVGALVDKSEPERGAAIGAVAGGAGCELF